MDLAERISKFFSLLGSDYQLLVAIIVTVVVFSVLYFYLIRFYINQDADFLVLIF